MRPGGLVWRPAHSYALGQRGLVVASSGVARSGETFNFRSFPLIPLVDAGQGCEVPHLRGNGGMIRVSDACNQCRGRRRDGAMGSCRRLGLARPAEPPGYTGDGAERA